MIPKKSWQIKGKKVSERVSPQVDPNDGKEQKLSLSPLLLVFYSFSLLQLSPLPFPTRRRKLIPTAPASSRLNIPQKCLPFRARYKQQLSRELRFHSISRHALIAAYAHVVRFHLPPLPRVPNPPNPSRAVKNEPFRNIIQTLGRPVFVKVKSAAALSVCAAAVC